MTHVTYLPYSTSGNGIVVALVRVDAGAFGLPKGPLKSGEDLSSGVKRLLSTRYNIGVATPYLLKGWKAGNVFLVELTSPVIAKDVLNNTYWISLDDISATLERINPLDRPIVRVAAFVLRGTDSIAQTRSEDMENPGGQSLFERMILSVVVHVVGFFCIAMWAAIGFFYWIPLLSRACALYSAGIIGSSLLRRRAAGGYGMLKRSTLFYVEGFRNIIGSIFQRDADTSYDEDDAGPFDWISDGQNIVGIGVRLVIETMFSVAFWGIIFFIFNEIKDN